MEKFICLTIHTERLHSDLLWKKIEKVLEFFQKKNVKATWFSINPSFIGYKFDEGKWAERIKFLIESSQEIQQHTHFYKGKEGIEKGLGYDLGKENARTRLLEDKNWLKEKVGIEPKGFVSGVFKITDEILKILEKEGYQYDLSKRGRNFCWFKDLLEIPTLSKLKSFLFTPKFIHFHNVCFSTIYFHDYDLEKLFFRNVLKPFILISHFLGVKFITTTEIYEKLRNITTPS